MNDIVTQMSLNTVEYTDNDTVLNPVSVNDKGSRLASRDKIEKYQDVLRGLAGSDHGDRDELNDNGLEEHFVDGAYIRGLMIPKGMTIVSELWNKERFWIIVSGEVTITSELGTQRIKAPYTGLAPFGSKIALFANEDTMWYAITGSESTDSASVKEEIVEKEYSGFTYPWDNLEHKAGDI